MYMLLGSKKKGAANESEKEITRLQNSQITKGNK